MKHQSSNAATARWKWLAGVVLGVSLVACGGGGGDASPAAPVTPTASVTGGGSVALGSTMTLTAGVTGATASKYQWYHNDVAILNANGSTFTAASAGKSSSGKYTVEVTTGAGTTLTGSSTVQVTGTDTASGSLLTDRIIVTTIDGGEVKQPSWDTAWTLTYQFKVPPLPASFDPNRHTFYIWGDTDFNPYGSKGAYKLSGYEHNQIVPYLFVGNALAVSGPGYKASGLVRSTWAVQAQYFWQKEHNAAADDDTYTQVGDIVAVSPGDLITTTIAYTPGDGKIRVAIGGTAGTSTVTLDRPFPNEPALFASWSDFFKRAQAASGGVIYARPMLNVESVATRDAMCSLLPFSVTQARIFGYTAAKDFAQVGPIPLPCETKQVSLSF